MTTLLILNNKLWKWEKNFHFSLSLKRFGKWGKSHFILSRVTLDKPQSITSFPKAPISVYYFQFSFSWKLPRLYKRHTTCSRRRVKQENLFATCCAASPTIFFLFSSRMRGSFFCQTNTLSVYYLPRTDEVDRSVIICVKRISNSLTFFLY